MPDDGSATRTATVGEALVEVLEAHGVRLGFGVISLHNMPVLDAILRRPPAIRFIPARGEAGAMNMADAATRVSGRPALCLTSTGTGAGNAMGALIEAQTAGTPLIHLTGQIDTLGSTAAGASSTRRRTSGRCWPPAARRRSASRGRRRRAASCARRCAPRETPPTGPVSVEIPIDVQLAPCPPGDPSPLPLPVLAPDPRALAEARRMLAAARRPLLLAGGGARHAAAAVAAFAEAGVPILTSVNGRGVIAEDHPACIGAFAASPALAPLLAACDCLIVAGSRLRSNETRTYATPPAAGPDPHRRRSRRVRTRLPRGAVPAGRCRRRPRRPGRGGAPRSGLGRSCRRRPRRRACPHARGGRRLCRPDRGAGRAYAAACPWVRDITLSNSIWGNRLPVLADARQGVHALGGGIGQGWRMRSAPPWRGRR